jgi:hypothetical protein
MVVERLTITVKPRSKQQALITAEDGSLIVHLKSAPAQGKANEELIRFLAESWQIPRSHIRISLGQRSRIKVVEIERG